MDILQVGKNVWIKPKVDPAPITYQQWVDVGFPALFTIDPDGGIMQWNISKRSAVDILAAHKCWLTEEAAQAWLDQSEY